ncbi:immunity 26/phosphotriesterase HocA family protein [Lysinibacillus cavernae]|uniref:immunity 26/phosphotriesterase HocA family protein n=1 Tax=Lysinibacillus cavernae TaxID=2666135 RepID=UPI0012D89533|nr:immunity 26/phosphotriesterase HocA family protein [Lysinibacillus cavernae]
MAPFSSWLTNSLRPYFGLHMLEEHWDTLQIREDYFICLEGDLIKKRIFVNEHSYQETDVDILTRNREIIVPQTARGKEKKLNYTNISSVKATGVVFSAGLGNEHHPSSNITIRNTKTYYQLPLSGFEHLTTKSAIINWLEQFPSKLPSDYSNKLEKLTRMKSLRYKAVPGDIFRVEIDLHVDGYVLVIGDLRQMQKDHLFAEDSIWHNVMTMPLFVRPYLLTTIERSPSLEKIIAAPLSAQTHIVMDDHFMRGCYEKVGHKTLTESDILFPMGYGQTLNYGKEPRYRLSWGPGTISKAASMITFQTASRFTNHGVYAGVASDWLKPEEGYVSKSLDHPHFHKERQQALAEFGLPDDITYDEFNRQTSGLTRKEYIHYINKTYNRSLKK